MSSKPIIVLFGGNGFLGKYTARMLVAKGYRVRLISRRTNSSFNKDENMESVCANALDTDAVVRAIIDAVAVINLIGILSPDKHQSFCQAHKQTAEIIATACRENHVPCFVHLSAIGADKDSSSLYAKSKAAGESAVLAAMPDAVILRPSIVFGYQDGFFSRFAAMAQFTPALPLIGGGRTLFQPVYIGDVALAILAVVEGRAQKGAIYELGGTAQQSFADLLAFICQTVKKKRILITLPFPVAHIVGWSMEIINKISGGRVPPIMMITRDQVELLRRDNVVSSVAIADGRTLQGLGILPQSMSPIVENYLRELKV